MHSQVRQLDLKLSLPPELQPQTAEVISLLRTGFLNRVVETIEDRFHAEYGSDAVIEIEDLVVRWDGAESAVADYDVARRVGEDIITGVLSEAELQSVGATADNPSSQAAKIYKSAAHRSTVRIAALSRKLVVRTTTTDQAKVEAEWVSLMDSGTGAVKECAQYLVKHTNVDDIVTVMRPQLLRQLMASLPLARWPTLLRTAIARICPELWVEQDSLLSKTHELEASDGEPQNGHSHKDNATGHEKEYSGEGWRDRVGEPERFENPEIEMGLRRNGTSHEAGECTGGPPAGEITDPSGWGLVASDNERDGTSASNSRTLRKHLSPAPQAASPIEAREAESFSQSTETNIAGLVYVLNLVRRIELPEILWCCGIDEKSFLFDLFRKLVGPEGQDDPIICAASGIAPNGENYQRSLLPEWAFDEVFSKVERNLQQLLPVGTLPLNVAPRERQEVANKGGENSGFWTELTRSLAVLIGDAFLKLVDTDGACDSPQEIVFVDGHIQENDAAISVRIPLESINIDVRKVALDANPGHLEWLHRSLMLEFSDA